MDMVVAVAEAVDFDASFLEIWTSSRYTTGLGSMLWVLSGRAEAWRATGYLGLAWLRNQAKLALTPKTFESPDIQAAAVTLLAVAPVVQTGTRRSHQEAQWSPSSSQAQLGRRRSASSPILRCLRLEHQLPGRLIQARPSHSHSLSWFSLTMLPALHHEAVPMTRQRGTNSPQRFAGALFHIQRTPLRKSRYRSNARVRPATRAPPFARVVPRSPGHAHQPLSVPR